MNILILMAGKSDELPDGVNLTPKYLTEIQNKPIAQRIIESIETIGNKIFCIIRKEDQENFFLGDMIKILSCKCEVLEVLGNTKGAVCSALYAIDKINSEEELLVLNGDQFIKTDLFSAVSDFRNRNLDAGVVSFEAVNPKYSSLLLDENNFVIQTSEKKPISKLASTGCCYFKHGNEFVKSCFSVIKKDVKINGQYYISSVLNELILLQKKVGVFLINKKDYISFANYHLVEKYRFQRRSK